MNHSRRKFQMAHSCKEAFGSELFIYPAYLLTEALLIGPKPCTQNLLEYHLHLEGCTVLLLHPLLRPGCYF